MEFNVTYISVIDIISFIFILFNIFILLTLVRMHSKQKSIRVGYFIVVFIQIIIELLLSILFLIVITLSLLKVKDNKLYFYIFPVLINFLYNIDILYNIQTIICLMKAKNKIESSDAFTSDDLSKSEEGGNSNTSIEIKIYSFRRIHFISFFFSFIHSFIYALIILKESQNPNMDWYFFLYLILHFLF